MIGRIQGILLEKNPPHLLVDVKGVAYELQSPLSTFYRLPDLNQEVILHTHLLVREDAHVLFGFSQMQERMLFRTLIKVSSIGPKSALIILSGMEAQKFVHCVVNHDTTALSRLPGIGKKTAERLVIEMKDKLTAWKEAETGLLPELNKTTEPVAVQEAISALIALGYKPLDAQRAVMKVENAKLVSRDVLIRQALQGML